MSDCAVGSNEPIGPGVPALALHTAAGVAVGLAAVVDTGGVAAVVLDGAVGVAACAH